MALFKNSDHSTLKRFQTPLKSDLDPGVTWLKVMQINCHTIYSYHTKVGGHRLRGIDTEAKLQKHATGGYSDLDLKVTLTCDLYFNCQ